MINEDLILIFTDFYTKIWTSMILVSKEKTKLKVKQNKTKSQAKLNAKLTLANILSQYSLVYFC